MRLLATVLFLSTALAAADMDPAALAKESEAACAASASTKPVPAMIIAKVDAAAALVAKDGKAAFASFRGKDSPFIFAGTYIWIHDLTGKMQLHPIMHKTEGKSMIGLKDNTGKALFVEMNALVEAKGQGWVDYWWPKPGDDKTKYSHKVSYVKLAKHADGDFVVGCGIYDLSEPEIAALVASH